MPTIGLFSLILPVEPKNLASPKAKIPPSEATNQYAVPADEPVPDLGPHRRHREGAVVDSVGDHLRSGVVDVALVGHQMAEGERLRLTDAGGGDRHPGRLCPVGGHPRPAPP